MFANPLVIFRCKKNEVAELSDEAYKEQRKKLGDMLLPFIAFLRLTNTILWVLLIGLYFNQVNGDFPKVKCHNGISYCSKDYLFHESCSISKDEFCEVHHQDTILILIFLSLSQWMVFFIKDRAANGEHYADCDDEYNDGVENPISSVFVYFGMFGFNHFYLFLLFILEAIALPFGTKEGHIAFVVMDPHYLEYSVSAFLSVLGFGIFLTLCQIMFLNDDTSSANACAWKFCVLMFFAFPYALMVIELLIHATVVTIWNIVDNYNFYGASMFFLSLKNDYLLYRSVRTFFSALTLLESFCTWILFRVDNHKRYWDKSDKCAVHAAICCLDCPSLIPAPDADQVE
jgi:hypothetical protein